MQAAAGSPIRFLVELVPTETSGPEQVGNEARAAARLMRLRGEAIRFIRTVAVPEDAKCFLLWEATSREALLEAVRLMGRAPVAVSETVAIVRRDFDG